MIYLIFLIPVCFILFQQYRYDLAQKELRINPCDAVWIGDSYFFTTMEVQDGHFNKAKIKEDENGLYLFRDKNKIDVLNEGGNKEYLRGHVQKAYLKFKENKVIH